MRKDLLFKSSESTEVYSRLYVAMANIAAFSRN